MNKFIFLIFIINFSIFSQGHYASVNKLLKNTEDNSIISIGKDEEILMWNLKNFKISNRISLNKGNLTNGVIIPELGYILTSSIEGILYFTSLRTNTLVDIKNLNIGMIKDIFYLGKGNLIIISKQGHIVLYNYNSDKILKSTKIAYSINNTFFIKNTLYIVDSKNNIHSLLINNFTLKELNINNTEEISSIIVNKNSIYISTWTGKLNVYNLNTLNLIYSFNASFNDVFIKLKSYKELILAGSIKGELYVYKNKELIKKIEGKKSSITDFIIENNLLIISYKDSYINFYDLKSLNLIHSFSDY